MASRKNKNQHRTSRSGGKLLPKSEANFGAKELASYFRISRIQLWAKIPGWLRVGFDRIDILLTSQAPYFWHGKFRGFTRINHIHTKIRLMILIEFFCANPVMFPEIFSILIRCSETTSLIMHNMILRIPVHLHACILHFSSTSISIEISSVCPPWALCMVDLAEYLDDKHEHLFSFKVRVLWKLTSYTPRLHFRLQLLWWQLTLKAYMLSWCLNKVANTANTYQLLELPSQNDESSKNRQQKCLVFCTPMRFWWIFGLPSSRSQLHRPGCGVPFADALNRDSERPPMRNNHERSTRHTQEKSIKNWWSLG